MNSYNTFSENTGFENSKYNKILDFWFENNIDFNKWFMSKNQYDEYIKRNFKKILNEAEKGDYLDWLSNHKSYLAMIILLDQFSRHIYRGTYKAYQNDEKALLFTEMGLDIHLNKFSAVEKMFVLMPYQHSENLDDQNFGVKILTNLISNEKNIFEKNILKKALYHQKRHLKVIEKFGRFPKRNIYLGRESTEEEIDYMDENQKYDY